MYVKQFLLQLLREGRRLLVHPLYWVIKNSPFADFQGRLQSKPVVLDSPKFGRSAHYTMGLEIQVANKSEFPGNVGEIVKDVYFQDSPPFNFNVMFSCGKPGFFWKGRYSDPTSHWFNVFFGYYQIDVKKEAWGRPFGYTHYGEEEGNRKLNVKELGRIAKADWNYFSNYLYGVPKDCITAYNDLPKDFSAIKVGTREIDGRIFDLLEMPLFQVVSAYEAQEGRAIVNPDGVVNAAWRMAFGTPVHRSAFPDSFFPVSMKVVCLVYTSLGDDPDLGPDTYKTFIFGGTINSDFPRLNSSSLQEQKQKEKFNEEFLEAQMQAVEQRIRESFPKLGFNCVPHHQNYASLV